MIGWLMIAVVLGAALAHAVRAEARTRKWALRAMGLGPVLMGLLAVVDMLRSTEHVDRATWLSNGIAETLNCMAFALLLDLVAAVPFAIGEVRRRRRVA